MKTYFLILMFFCIAKCFPQIEKEKLKVEFENRTISMIEIENSELINLFDTLLKEERKCNYFTEFVSYKVVFDSIHDKYGKKHLVISVLGYDNFEQVLSRNESIIGFYFHQNHYFFIQGEPSCIYSVKQDSFSFKFRNLPPDEDDRWTIYRFVFHEKNFILYAKENSWLCN